MTLIDVNEATATGPDPLLKVFEYHQATKHHFQGYARGPGYMDWATQPNPFRRFAGARLMALEKIPPTAEPLYDDAFVLGRIPPVPVTLRSISQLFYDSLAISAWKSIGETSWSLRVNPSSGNLHPTEGYLICGPIEGLCDKPMVCHYAPQEHTLEVRAEFEFGLWEQLCVRFPRTLSSWDSLPFIVESPGSTVIVPIATVSTMPVTLSALSVSQQLGWGGRRGSSTIWARMS